MQGIFWEYCRAYTDSLKLVHIDMLNWISVITEVNSKPCIKSVKKFSDTRWVCRSDAIRAVSENFSAILKALDEIEQRSHNGQVTAEASGLRYQMLKFDCFV